MLMVQQVYPHFVGQQQQQQQSAGGDDLRKIVTERPPQTHSPEITIDDRNTSRHEMSISRSVSPRIMYSHHQESMARPQSPINNYGMQSSISMRLVKPRSNSIDEEYYDADATHVGRPPPPPLVNNERHYESDPELIEYNRGSRHHQYHTEDEQDDNAPLDLSLPVGRRRDRTFSGTDSDDSGGHGEEKPVDKAAYKKNLMKRYRELFFMN